MSLHCPACGHKQLCPCAKCDNYRRSTGNDLETTPWKWIAGFGIRCGECGFDGSSEFWSALEKVVENWGDRATLEPIKPDFTKETLALLDKLKSNQYKANKEKDHEESNH